MYEIVRRCINAMCLVALGALCPNVKACAQAAPPPLQTNGSQFIELMPRSQAPAVSLKRLDGKSIPLDKFRGKVVLLSFWATWCPPCRRELPSLERLKTSVDSRNLEIVPVSVDKTGKAAVEDFLRRANVRDLEIYLDSQQRIAGHDEQETQTPFLLYGMPITYVIDKDGWIIGYVTGEVDWASAEAASFLGYFMDRSATLDPNGRDLFQRPEPRD